MKIGHWDTHPAADCVRLMMGAEFDSLVESVRIEGQRQAIVLIADTDPDTGEVRELVLDGRNRLRACLAAGVEPQFAVYTGSDPWTFVALSRQRMSMSASERACMAAEMMPALQAEARRRDGVNVRKGAAREIASELCGVSESYVDRANYVRHAVSEGACCAELYDLLREGEAGLSEVREAAEWPLEAQLECLADVTAGKPLREAVAERRAPEAVDVERFAERLTAWVKRETKAWTPEQRAEVPRLMRDAAEAVWVGEQWDEDLSERVGSE